VLGLTATLGLWLGLGYYGVYYFTTHFSVLSLISRLGLIRVILECVRVNGYIRVMVIGYYGVYYFTTHFSVLSLISRLGLIRVILECVRVNGYIRVMVRVRVPIYSSTIPPQYKHIIYLYYTF